MTLYDFLADHPITTIILALPIITFTFALIFAIFFRLPNRIMRHRNIRKHGWPPPHCDADGDFKPDEEKK